MCDHRQTHTRTADTHPLTHSLGGRSLMGCCTGTSSSSAHAMLSARAPAARRRCDACRFSHTHTHTHLLSALLWRCDSVMRHVGGGLLRPYTWHTRTCTPPSSQHHTTTHDLNPAQRTRASRDQPTTPCTPTHNTLGGRGGGCVVARPRLRSRPRAGVLARRAAKWDERLSLLLRRRWCASA